MNEGANACLKFFLFSNLTKASYFLHKLETATELYSDFAGFTLEFLSYVGNLIGTYQTTSS